MSDAATTELLATITPIEAAPRLRTVNGFGFRLCGTLRMPGVTGAYISAYWFVLLFLPVIPIRLYVVSGGSGGSYRFFGVVRFAQVLRSYGGRAWWLIVSAWIEGALMFVALAIAFSLAIGVMMLLRHH